MKLYKRASIVLSLGIMLIGLISFKLSPSSNVDASDSDTNIPTEIVLPGDAATTPTPLQEALLPSPTDAPVITETPIDNPPVEAENKLLREAYPEIHTLVEKYLNAKLDCTMIAFRDVVTDTRYINLEKVAESTQSIKAYNDIVCYTKQGYGDIDLIVYCTYNMEIVKIDSTVPSIDSFYVQYDEQGTPKIFGGILDDKTIAELDKITAESDVQRLIEATTEQIRKRLQTDEELREFWDNLLNKIDEGENV